MIAITTLNRYCRLHLALLVLIAFYQRKIISHGFLVVTSNDIPSRSHTLIHEKHEQSEEEEEHPIHVMTEIDMENSFNCSNFAATKCWGTSPLLMRGAFHSQSDLLVKNTHQIEGDDEVSSSDFSLWPTWDEVIELALDEDAESRLITHVPDDPSSWRLTLGPFNDDQITSLDNTLSSSRTSAIEYDEDSLLEPNERWTLVFNDVDRFHPPLFDFITDHFSFIPEWRKDDGQSE